MSKYADYTIDVRRADRIVAPPRLPTEYERDRVATLKHLLRTAVTMFLLFVAAVAVSDALGIDLTAILGDLARSLSSSIGGFTQG